MHHAFRRSQNAPVQKFLERYPLLRWMGHEMSLIKYPTVSCSRSQLLYHIHLRFPISKYGRALVVEISSCRWPGGRHPLSIFITAAPLSTQQILEPKRPDPSLMTGVEQ